MKPVELTAETKLGVQTSSTPNLGQELDELAKSLTVSPLRAGRANVSRPDVRREYYVNAFT